MRRVGAVTGLFQFVLGRIWFHSSSDDKQDDSYNDKSDTGKERDCRHPIIPWQWNGWARAVECARWRRSGTSEKTDNEEEESNDNEDEP